MQTESFKIGETAIHNGKIGTVTKLSSTGNYVRFDPKEGNPRSVNVRLLEKYSEKRS